MLLEGFEILGKEKSLSRKTLLILENLVDAPPSAMRTILQNRWFSEAFREQALNKAVSCALKVRRATAKVTDQLFPSFQKSHFLLASRWISNNISHLNRRYDTSIRLGYSRT